MKYSKYLLSILIFLFFVGCKQVDAVPYFGIDFLFKEPQPINDKELNYLPNRFVGKYINQDSTYLIIEDNTIYYKWTIKNQISNSRFDSIKDSVKIIQNRMYLFNNKKFYEYRKLKDSIEISDTEYDTLFSISNLHKVKRIKNSIILNTKDSIFWKIQVFSLDKKELKVMTLVSDEDLRRIDSLSNIKSKKIDSTKSVFQLSKKEFKKMMSLKNLGYIKEYKKLN